MLKVIESGAAFAYSAYLDDRETARDVTQLALPVVRVFVYYRMARRLRPKNDWRCVMWYQEEDEQFGVVVPVLDITDHDVNRNGQCE